MIETYKNISTTYYLLGLLPVDAAVLVMVVFPFLVFGWWFLAFIILFVGYKLFSRWRDRHYDYIDLFIYLFAVPCKLSIEREKIKDDYKT